MAKIQIITAVTMDGFLPKADENLMQWVLNDSKGFPYWHERSIYRLVPNYRLRLKRFSMIPINAA